MRRLAPLCLVAAFGTAGSVALAASGAVNQIINECPSGQLTGPYTVQQLRQALRQLPTSLNEYSSCADVINRAILADQQHRAGSAGTTSGGSFLPTPVIVVLAVLVVAALVFGGLAVRNRRQRAEGGRGVGRRAP